MRRPENAVHPFTRTIARIRANPKARAFVAFALGAVAAIVPIAFYAGFTVDDALIPARYAHHVALGAGYTFNAGSPPTDGVTPLGFPYLLAPFAARSPLAALAFARALGALAWVVAGGIVAVTIDRTEGSRARFAALLLAAVSAPLGAWSQAGLETGLATLLIAIALGLRSIGRGYGAAVAAGIAAALRPEVLPLALVVAFPSSHHSSSDGGASIGPSHFLRLAIASTPFAAVALVRLAIFGHVAPLSFYAKPPDASLGAPYALACFILTGPPALLVPFALRKLPRETRWFSVAVVVHYAAVVAVGGDWMPLSRSIVPSMPVVIVAAVSSLCDSRHRSSASGVSLSPSPPRRSPSCACARHRRASSPIDLPSWKTRDLGSRVGPRSRRSTSAGSARRATRRSSISPA